MDEAAGRVADWKLKVDGFDGIEGGLLATYRQARKTMGAAYGNPTAENFHEWRKQAKYHGYHMRLLRELWKPVMRSLEKEADELSDLLGDDHNLDVLHKTLLKSPNRYGKKRDIQVLLGLIDRRSAELRVEAKTSGARIFAEKPKADFGKHQAFEISPKYVELDFLASLVDLITDFLNPSTIGPRPKRIELIVTQFDFQFPALQTPAAFISLKIALGDFPQPHLGAGDIDCEVTLNDILGRIFFDIFRGSAALKNSLDFVAAFVLGHLLNFMTFTIG
jgi:hypothetical protein